MDSKVKAKWLAALRSGKYKQVKSNLKKNGKFCCLGVLCDLYQKETGNGKWIRQTSRDKRLKVSSFKIGNEVKSDFLPDAVQKWAKLDRENPIVNKEGLYGSLSDFNDAIYDPKLKKDIQCDFKQIADIIEEQL